MRKQKSKKVVYELIPAGSTIGKPMYVLLGELVEKYHEHLEDARIALAFCTSWKPDTDGRLVLGKLKKSSDLDRELADFDFIILLNRKWWYDPGVTEKHRAALLDHELCHGQIRLDKFLEPMYDERGRKIWRTRKHDIEEFKDIVERHGCYKADLQAFATAILKKAPKQPVLDNVKDDKAADKKKPAAAAATH